VVEIRETSLFSDWLESLRDNVARTRIQARILRLSAGNPGDVKPVGEGVSEMRIDHGPGYRVYFVRKGSKLIVLLAGGDKGTQAKDIRTALKLAKEL
jgi:putative addiction module killer protein